MVSTEMLKLVGIVGGGIVLAVVGQMIILKKKKAKELSKKSESSGFSSQVESSVSDDEKKAKEYIEQYKTSYPRESVKAGLLNFGISDTDAEGYMNKYM